MKDETSLSNTDIRKPDWIGFQVLAAELVTLQPNVIPAIGGDVAPIAKRVDQKIPLVFVSSADAEQLGLVTSLRRPDGNATGVTLFQDEFASKRLELLKEAVPNISRVAFVWYPDHPDSEHRNAQQAAQALAMHLHSAEVRSSDGIGAALNSANEAGIDAIYVVSSRLTVLNLKALVQFAAKNRFPVVGGLGAWAKEGGLFSYGPDIVAMADRAANYIDKIFKGANPGDLPVEQPAKFEIDHQAQGLHAHWVSNSRNRFFRALRNWLISVFSTANLSAPVPFATKTNVRQHVGFLRQTGNEWHEAKPRFDPFRTSPAIQSGQPVGALTTAHDHPSHCTRKSSVAPFRPMRTTTSGLERDQCPSLRARHSSMQRPMRTRRLVTISMATFGWLMPQARWKAFTFIAVIAAATLNAAFEKAATQDVPSLSQVGLRRIGDYMRHEIATGKIPGAIVLIQQHGRPVYFEKFGARDVTARLPMTDDTVFRLYSMSKPITSVAAMMLIDDGKLSLDDPVSKYIPAFADVKVGVEARDKSKKPTLSREPLKRPITILDLLRHTSGITYGFYGERAIRTFYEKADLYAGDVDNAEFVARLAKLPLAEQPGMVWDYGHSTDVLGRVIEVISGQSLFQFEKERLFDPLGMTHTAYYVADEFKRGLVAQFLPREGWKPFIGIREPMERTRFESGGAGLTGTVGDYARFAQMLLSGGTLDGRRYLKSETVALMTSDHIGSGSGITHTHLYFLSTESRYGLGVAVLTAEPRNKPWPPGEYGWSGAAGTFFFIDPKDDLFVICMMQTHLYRGRIEEEMARLVYEATR